MVDINFSVNINRCKNINKMMPIQNIVIETLACKKCKNIPFRPYKLQQNSSTYYCISCLETMPDFPTLRHTIIPPSFLEEKLLDKLEIQCRNSIYGCTMLYNYKQIQDLNDHEIECDKNFIGCPWKGCKEKLRKPDLDNHLMTCDYVKIKCTRCFQKFGQNSAKFHDCIPSLYKMISKLKDSIYKREEKTENKLEALIGKVDGLISQKQENEKVKDLIEEMFGSDNFSKRLRENEVIINLKGEILTNLQKEQVEILSKTINTVDEKIVSFKEELQLLQNKIIEEMENRLGNLMEKVSSEDGELLHLIEDKLNYIQQELSDSRKKHEEHIIVESKLDCICKDLLIEKEKIWLNFEQMRNESLQEAITKIRRLEETTTAINNEILLLTKSSFFVSQNSKKAIFHETIKSHPIFKEIISNKQINLLFKASDNNYLASRFHEICDGIKNTITVVKSENGNIFGGYSPVSWKQVKKGYTRDVTKKGFLFSLTHSTKHIHYLNDQKAVFSDFDIGPTFGGGFDLHISNECNKNTASYTRLGHTYKLPEGIKLDSDQAKNYLAGSYNFKVIEYEIYQIV